MQHGGEWVNDGKEKWKWGRLEINLQTCCGHQRRVGIRADKKKDNKNKRNHSDWILKKMLGIIAGQRLFEGFFGSS